MAKELGFQPSSLIKSIPSRSQMWKAPVNEWVRSLYEKKVVTLRPAPQSSAPAPSSCSRVIEFRNPDHPWPDNPEIPDFVVKEWTEDFDYEDNFEPPVDEEIEDQNILMLRRQRLFRWAAQAIAVAVSELPEVQKLAAFGAVAQPLATEVPRFRRFRRHRIEILHECADLDLAVWMAGLHRLKDLQKALNQGLRIVQDTPYGGVAHHSVDVHIIDAAAGDYCGRLCKFRECPKAGKRECRVPGCGAEPFLQQFEGYRFNPAQFEAEPKVLLFDRAGRFLVRKPRIETHRRFEKLPNDRDEDVPF